MMVVPQGAPHWPLEHCCPFVFAVPALPAHAGQTALLPRRATCQALPEPAVSCSIAQIAAPLCGRSGKHQHSAVAWSTTPAVLRCARLLFGCQAGSECTACVVKRWLRKAQPHLAQLLAAIHWWPGVQLAQYHAHQRLSILPLAAALKFCWRLSHLGHAARFLRNVGNCLLYWKHLLCCPHPFGALLLGSCKTRLD